VITTTGLELRAGARILLSDINLRIQPGDRIGLVGRNGAGKTTTLKVLAGEGTPHAGAVERRGPVGYLPQDPRTGDLGITASDRVLSARGLDVLRNEMKELEGKLADDERFMRRYGQLEDQFASLGGYAAEAEAARICANLGLPDRALAQPIGTLSGGQRRRIELARILFADSGQNGRGILLLDEPTNHLDQDSIVWLRGYMAQHKGGLVVISHDVGLLEAAVNKVWYLDANRAVVDVYNTGWAKYLEQRETDERRRRRERANAEKKAGALMAQADKMRA
jgi:ATPase subunit of ABC transporter with duplicated ATPase domains